MEPNETVCHGNSKTLLINHRTNVPFMQTQFKCNSMRLAMKLLHIAKVMLTVHYYIWENDIEFALLHLPAGCMFVQLSINKCKRVKVSQSIGIWYTVYRIPYSWWFWNWEIISKFVSCVPVYWMHTTFVWTSATQSFCRADDATVIVVVWLQCFNFVFDDIMGLFVCSTKWLSN